MLAWMMQCNLCANIIGYLDNIINSKEFLNRHRFSDKFFIRERLLSFPTLIYYFINLPKGAYQNELDNYYKTLAHLECAEHFVSKAALCKARNKIKFEAFVELNQDANNYFRENMAPHKWHGFNLLTTDGSTVRLPKQESVIDFFGDLKPNNGKACPLGRVSQLYDVLNETTIDAILSPIKVGERELAAQHYLNLLPDDLILLDRGYPAYWLFNLILSQGANFCARISCTKWRIIRKFFESGKNEKIISLNAPSSSLKQCKEMGLGTKPLRLRVIRVELDTGETEILITSLTKKKRFPIEEFSELYHYRWPVEEDYKVMKCRIEIENFSGKSVLSVMQDFHSRVFTKNITAILAHFTESEIDRRTAHRKHPYQINFTEALSKIKNTIVLLFNRPKEIVKSLISRLHNIFVQSVEPVRPGRTFPRKHKIRRREFYPTYKRTS